MKLELRRAINWKPRYVLDQILSGEATEVVVENVHEYLTTISENIRAGKIGLEEFIIFKVSSLFLYRELSLIYIRFV